MDAKWLGPLLVSREFGKGFSGLDGENVITKIINGAHLKVYVNPHSKSHLH